VSDFDNRETPWLPQGTASARRPVLGVVAGGPKGTAERPEFDPAAVESLRRVLRAAVEAELPSRSQEQQRRSGAPATLEARRVLARTILDDALRRHNETELSAGRPLVGRGCAQLVVVEVVNSVFGLAGLQPLLEDPRVETINANRFDRVFVQYTDGRRAQVDPIAASNEELTDLVRLLAARASSQERRFDQGSPAVNLQLPGGERLFAVMGVTADGVTSVSIRGTGSSPPTSPSYAPAAPSTTACNSFWGRWCGPVRTS
jgi:Flp pilus assembly protein, ATPase CpaF